MPIHEHTHRHTIFRKKRNTCLTKHIGQQFRMSSPFQIRPLLSHHGPFYLHRISLITAWKSNIHYNVWHEITYSFPGLNSKSVEVWGWMRNFNSHLTVRLIICLYCGLRLIHFSERCPCHLSLYIGHTIGLLYWDWISIVRMRWLFQTHNTNRFFALNNCCFENNCCPSPRCDNHS